jgi:hypothetical protein
MTTPPRRFERVLAITDYFSGPTAARPEGIA